MTCLRVSSKIGQFCLAASLVFTVVTTAFEAQAQMAANATETVTTQDLMGKLRSRGASAQDLVFLSRLIQQFNITAIPLQELNSGHMMRLAGSTFKIEGHVLDLAQLGAEQMWKKILHVLTVSQSYEGHPWESFLDAPSYSPAEKRATIFSLAIYAWDELGARLPASKR